MTKDIIERNRGLYIKEFKATGRSGVEHIISYLDSHHFFEARCNGHDREPGGTANHSLWVLKFARETREMTQTLPLMTCAVIPVTQYAFGIQVSSRK